MSTRCDLDGTTHYEWGKGYVYPPTEKQENLIKFIQDMLDLRFTGNSSREAYEFIGKHHRRAVSVYNKK